MFTKNAMDHFFNNEEPIETINPSNGRSAKIDVNPTNGTFVIVTGADIPQGSITVQADFDVAVFVANALLACKA